MLFTLRFLENMKMVVSKNNFKIGSVHSLSLTLNSDLKEKLDPATVYL